MNPVEYIENTIEYAKELNRKEPRFYRDIIKKVNGLEIINGGCAYYLLKDDKAYMIGKNLGLSRAPLDVREVTQKAVDKIRKYYPKSKFNIKDSDQHLVGFNSWGLAYEFLSNCKFVRGNKEEEIINSIQLEELIIA